MQIKEKKKELGGKRKKETKMEKIKRLSLKGISVQRSNLKIILCAFKKYISIFFTWH